MIIQFLLLELIYKVNILNLYPLIKHNLFFSIKIISFVSIIWFKLLGGKTPGSEKQQIKQKINVPPYKIVSRIDNIILLSLLLSL